MAPRGCRRSRYCCRRSDRPKLATVATSPTSSRRAPIERGPGVEDVQPQPIHDIVAGIERLVHLRISPGRCVAERIRVPDPAHVTGWIPRKYRPHVAPRGHIVRGRVAIDSY